MNAFDGRLAAIPELRSEQLHLARVENYKVIPGNATNLMFSNPGQNGVVQSIWMATGGGNAPSLDGRLRVYYGTNKAIDIDLGTLLATHWGASGQHMNTHVSVDISDYYNTGFLLTFPMPFGTDGIRIDYYNTHSGQNAIIYSMVTWRYTDTDEANGLRLKCQGKRFTDERVVRAANQVTDLAVINGGPGSIVYHSMVGGVGAGNLSWMERNISIRVDGESVASIESSGTEDWFDSAWYFQGRSNYHVSPHTYVGTDKPAFMPNAVGMATDLLSKWGGVPFKKSAIMRAETEGACNTGDTLTWAILYYQV